MNKRVNDKLYSTKEMNVELTLDQSTKALNTKLDNGFRVMSNTRTQLRKLLDDLKGINIPTNEYKTLQDKTKKAKELGFNPDAMTDFALQNYEIAKESKDVFISKISQIISSLQGYDF